MQAALGIHQLKKLNKTISKRININNLIWKKLKNHKVVSIPVVPKNFYLAPYRCYIKLNFQNIKKKYNLKKIIRLLNSREKICNEGSCSEMYLENSFKNSNFSLNKRLETASRLSAVSLAFFINPFSTNSELSKKMNNIIKVFNQISV